MRRSLAAVLVLICVVTFGAVASADKKMGIADHYQISFPENVRIADTLLPKGDYDIRHVMEGTDHIMVFRQIGVKNPIEVRAKCKLVPLEAKAEQNKKIYVLNAANERVLQELVFRGDHASHVF
jgi:hypothetical protein